MAAENQLTVDGTEVEVPTMDTFSMDEAQVLYDYSGCIVEDFVSALNDGDTPEKTEEKLRNPAVIRALVHIAYLRANPDAKPADAKKAVGKVNHLEALVWLLGDQEQDGQSPPASTSEQDRSSPNERLTSLASSGDDSTNDSAPPDNQDALTTTTKSGTSFISGQEASAA